MVDHHAPLNSCRVDGHVHLHPNFEIAQLLDSACHNMELSPAFERSTGILLLTEMAGINRFRSLIGRAGDWLIRPCSEAVSLLASHEDGRRIFIVAGRQVVVSERLEVLIHGVEDVIPEGLPLREVMATASDLGVLAVLPWGVGKWTGARGSIIQSLASSPPASDRFFFADCGVRLKKTPRPKLLANAEENGWCVLAGSDPLPLPNQASVVGRFGFIAELPLDSHRPFKSLETWLRSCRHSPQSYGALQGLAGFLVNQTTMQIRKHLR